ncbi:MAG: TRAP transporter small permease [Stappiaceae bacterium]
MPFMIKKKIEQGLERLALAFAIAAALAMVSIVVIIVTSVLMRKFANTPIHITEEMVGLLLSVSLFLGLPMVTLKAQHVRVSIVADQLRGVLGFALQTLALVAALIFFSWLIWESIPWLEFAFNRSLKTQTSRILLYPWMAALPLSLAVTWMIFAARLFGIIDRSAPASEFDAETSLPDAEGR